MSEKISISPRIPPVMGESIIRLIDEVSTFVIRTDDDANVMAQLLRKTVTKKAQLADWIRPTKQMMQATHKSMVAMEKDLMCGLDACEGIAREKIASHCEEQFRLADDAVKAGDVPTRAMPKLDGVSVRDKLNVTITDAGAVIDWLIENGYKDVLSVKLNELTKIVELRLTHMDVPGVDVEKRVSLAVRKETE